MEAVTACCDLTRVDERLARERDREQLMQSWLKLMLVHVVRA
jgi:hypothetical protein